MSSSLKQWVPNKVTSVNPIQSKPFDGSFYSNNGNYKFKISHPGLVGGLFPDNMWENSSTLYSGTVPKNGLWYLVAKVQLYNGSVTSVFLSILTEFPSPPQPTKNSPPTEMDVIIWVGEGIKKPYKMFDGNIVIKPVLVQRSYRTNIECGLSNYEDYYSLVAMI